MAAPQPATPVPTRPQKADPPPRLIVADAAVTLVERWKAELTVLRRRSPTSDAVGTLSDCVRELVDAINAGHALTVQLTIVEARAVSHIPASTLRWLCKNKPETIGAHKREGIWYIDRSSFERYLGTAAGHAAVPPHTPVASSAERRSGEGCLTTDLGPDARPDLRLETR